jgi:hypothetical protein
MSCRKFRLFQRYHGLVLPSGAYSKMIRHIRSGHRQAYLIRRRDEKHAVWAIWISTGQLIFVVYDPHTQTAVAALANNTQLQQRYQRARALKAAPQLAAEAASEHAVATMNLSSEAR